VSRKIGAHVSSAGSPIKALSRAKAIGANCLQIFAGSPRSWARKLWDQATTDEFIQLAEGQDLLPLFIHALYLVNLGSDNPELVKKSSDSLVMDMKNGEVCNGSGVIVHLGSYKDGSFAAVKEELLLRIGSVIDQTEAVPFVIENSSGQKGKIGTLEEIGEIFAGLKHPRLKLCLDSAHLFEAGWDLRRPDEVERLVETLGKMNLLSELVCLHLNDSKTKLDSRHDQHANLGEGEIGAEGLANFANHPQLVHLPLILEVPGADRQGPDKANIDLAKGLALGV
jgi:deoxyribonuclease-4